MMDQESSVGGYPFTRQRKGVRMKTSEALCSRKQLATGDRGQKIRESHRRTKNHQTCRERFLPTIFNLFQPTGPWVATTQTENVRQDDYSIHIIVHCIASLATTYRSFHVTKAKAKARYRCRLRETEMSEEFGIFVFSPVKRILSMI
jgi:hypothetical protein